MSRAFLHSSLTAGELDGGERPADPAIVPTPSGLRLQPRAAPGERRSAPARSRRRSRGPVGGEHPWRPRSPSPNHRFALSADRDIGDRLGSRRRPTPLPVPSGAAPRRRQRREAEPTIAERGGARPAEVPRGLGGREGRGAGTGWLQSEGALNPTSNIRNGQGCKISCVLWEK